MENSFEYDVFISHASEDKDSFVRPLADALCRKGLRVWYDEFTLTVGDSLRRNIDQGLSRSRYGIVVLSANFFAKEWPQKELDGLASREIEGQKIILPVWLSVGRENVVRYSPMLADRVAAQASRGVDQVVSALLKAVKHSVDAEKGAGEKTQQPSDQGLPIINIESTVFFSERMRKAFPGVDGLYWITSSVEAVDRLGILLQAPLEFECPEHLRNIPARISQIRTDPVWWWRGYRTLQITRFQDLGNGMCLMDYHQLDIKRIAAYRNHSNYREFVYVETKAEPPTGIYVYGPEDIPRMAEKLGFAAEEYGVFGETLISRAELDDGAAVVNGKVINAPDAQLRIRYLTPYNFIIAAADSPINNKDYDLIVKDCLDRIIRGSHTIEEFIKIANKFDRRYGY